MQENPQPTNSKKTIIIVIAAVVLLGIGITFQVLSNKEETNNENTNTVTNGETDTNATIEENTNAVVGSTDPVAKARDAQRVNDITTIRTGLESYMIVNERYPGSLEDLVSSGQLGSVPTNPIPGGRDYSYTPIGVAPFQYYDLCYTLETSMVENIDAGDHCATPDGLVGLM
ncbi:MAG: hypothetical protein ABIB97_04135 [Patescibacteria group bacterium]